MAILRFFFVTTLTSCIQHTIAGPDKGAPCRFIPGDVGWPSLQDWAELNSTVGGRLIVTVPVASICHMPTYRDTECAILKEQWNFPPPYLDSPADIMAPYFQNQSCNPFTPTSTPCTLGNYVPYSVNVSCAEDVVAGLQFAKKKNVRLVIKNTGHDLLGKSTGIGGLGLWMHNLASIEVIDSFHSPGYQGPAMKLGAGVIAADAYTEAHKYGLRIVGGSCPTVGLAGGYTQGGGYGILSGMHGLGADNVLEWELITASGEYLIASPMQNSDLYWALSGGGGGTYGVVLSTTMRLHQDGPVGGAFLAFNSTNSGASEDQFWDAVELFHASLPPILDTGTTIVYQIQAGSFAIWSLTAPGQTKSQVADLLSPFLQGLEEHKMPYTFIPSSSETYYDHYTATFGPLPFGPVPVPYLLSSRLVPRSAVADNPAAVNDALKTAVASGNFLLACTAVNANFSAPVASNAVLPAWRSALTHCIVERPWDWSVPRVEMLAQHRELTDVIVPALMAATPGSGTYANEADFTQPEWQREFYGENYQKLVQIKNKYDPDGVFYGVTAVRSEAWEIDGEGRLCRAGGAGVGRGNGVTAALKHVEL